MTDSSGRQDREKWNRRYRGSRAAHFRAEPADWLLMHRRLLQEQPQGRALDVASGAGRNTFYLADIGFVVDAWDISDVAVEKVASAAIERGLDIRARQCDLTEVSIPELTFQVVVNLYYLERSLFKPLADALVPGGLLLFESFLADPETVSRRPTNPKYVLSPGELRDAFPSLQVLDYREEAKEGPRRNSGAVARLLARRAPTPSP